MPAYAIGYLWDVVHGPGITEYLERIDATLAPFGGSFVVHGGALDRLEGDLPDGDAIVIEFPDMPRARAWYVSDDYRAIKPLRTRNASGHVLLVDGVGARHRAVDVLAG